MVMGDLERPVTMIELLGDFIKTYLCKPHVCISSLDPSPSETQRAQLSAEYTPLRQDRG
jgi:hypothetical protein